LLIDWSHDVQQRFRSLVLPASILLITGGTFGSHAAIAATTATIEIIAVGTPATDAEDANGNPEDGCRLSFEIVNRSGIDLKTFSASFDVMTASTGAPLKAHFKIARSGLAAGVQQITPPDLIHAVKCPDLKVLMKGRTCIADRIVDCPPLALSARGLATIELRKKK